jgi:hypothetical protein
MHLKISSILSLVVMGVLSCSGTNDKEVIVKRSLSDDFKKYWFSDGAEITSYDLVQARYGELRKGKSVSVFVTETFSKDKLVKADNPTSSDIPVLKLNFTKNFITGIYPYSMMTSSFFPLTQGEHALKISSSMQEWCGHAFVQLENRKDFNVQMHSYFESEGEQEIKLQKGNLEDEIWSNIRISPEKLPLGQIKIVPSFFYLRLTHLALAYQNATASKIELSATEMQYTLSYPALKRTVKVNFEKAFPHRIVKFEESYPDGFANQTMLTTTGTLLKSIRSKYWEKNAVVDEGMRKELGL